ncbi:MAG: fumarylacetoacetate hydrolase family protein [Chloroflexi bacterium]|nr:fumarylacetoacetate hydrolase family protein [Chloroflexota bacterium]
MKVVRYRGEAGPAFGVLEGDSVYTIVGDVFGKFRPGERVGAVKELVLLAPCEPTKIVGVGLNYRDHAREAGVPAPEEPVLFVKPSTAAIGPDADIVWPARVERVDFEAEMAVVIGRRAHDVAVADALAYVLGYTCGNDVTARDLQRRDGQWMRAKSYDTFCPLGPYVAVGIDPSNLPITSRLNGDVRQHSATSNLIFGVPELVSFISHVMTLLPGDVILTGTPGRYGTMRAGDVVEIEVGPIGPLRNRLVRR